MRKNGIISHIFFPGTAGLAILIFLAAILAGPVRAQDQSQPDPLGKIQELLGQVKKYVNTLTESEAGEKELLKFLAAEVSTNAKIQREANEFVNKMNSDSVIEKATPIFSGYLGDMAPKDLVKTVREKLEPDGYRYVEEESSWGETRVRFFKEAPDQPRNVGYLLRIDTGWVTRIMDSVQGQGGSGHFYLIKIEKV